LIPLLNGPCSFHKHLSLAAGQSIDTHASDVVKGVAQLYSGIIQPQRNMKVNFLSTLLKNFEIAVDMDSQAAATSDMSLLRFLALVAASLPFRRSDEPLSILHCINGIVSRRAEFVRTALKAKLKAATELVSNATVSVGEPANPTGADPDDAVTVDMEAELQATKDMLIELKAAYAVTLLLQLKHYIKTVYRLDSDRIANFSPSGEKRKNEERVACSKGKGPGISLAAVPLGAFSSLQEAANVYTLFKSLMSEDTADYGDGIHLNLSKKARRAMESMQDGTPQST